MRVMVVMNPCSDQGRGIRRREGILAAASQYGGLDLVLTEGRGHGQELAKTAAQSGYDLVVAAGGDGTAHEVVNGLMVAGVVKPRLGLIPIGTGNDLAFGLGLPLADPGAAVARLFEGKPRLLDLGHIEKVGGEAGYFHNNVGIGTDAIVVIRAESMTRLRGFLLYLAAVIQTIAFHFRTLHLEMDFDGETVAQDALLLAMGNGPRHGGGFLLTPDAVQDDGLVDSCLAEPMGRLPMIWLVARSLKGKHKESRRVSMRRSKQILVRSDVPMPIHADGEMFAYPQDDVRQVRISAVPAALEVMV